jgi:hypothetical protein
LVLRNDDTGLFAVGKVAVGVTGSAFTIYVPGTQAGGKQGCTFIAAPPLLFLSHDAAHLASG